jgi:hypothetical protein
MHPEPNGGADVFGKGRKQRDTYRAWALERGWVYAEQDDALARPGMWGLSRAYASHPQAVDVLTGGHRGRPAVCFTYRYRETTQGGNGPEQRRAGTGFYTVRLSRSLPAIEVKQRWFLDGRLTTLPADADFGRTYEVVADATVNLASILTPALCAWMLQQRAAGFQIADDRLYLRVGQQVNLDRLDSWLDYLADVADRLPV